MNRASFSTAGCKLNYHETRSLKGAFHESGYLVVGDGEEAEVCIVNTCTVTARGDADSRQLIRRAIRNRPDGGMVVVTGCYAQRDADAVASIPGVDLVVGNREKADIPGFVERLRAEPAGTDRRVVVSPDPTTDRFLDISPSLTGGRTRATLKIQDGCDARCTYCVVPKVRGAGRSRDLGEVIRQAAACVQSGYREIVLTGVNTASYESSEKSLAGLLQELGRVRGLDRVRLSSIEPNLLSDDLICVMAGDHRVCNHIHVPLQSGDDATLRRMGRRYDSAFYSDRVRQTADRIPDVAIGADVMVGFPGEDEAAFERTVRLVSELPLAYLHVFTYSPREGAASTRIGPPVGAAELVRRSRVLRDVGRQKREQFLLRFEGRRLRLLIEDKRDPAFGRLTGLSDNYIRFHLDPDGAPAGECNYGLVNRMVEATVLCVRNDHVVGRIDRIIS